MTQTHLLYQDDVYMKQCPAAVLAVRPAAGGAEADLNKTVGASYRLVLDQTVCFPEGGGQPCDHGLIPGIGRIVGVYDCDGEILHDIASASPAPAVGTAVSVELDWPRRFSHMQRHAGEHVLSAVFHERFGGVNRGFHMGDDYMTIDIRLEGNSAVTELTDEDMATAEWEANRLIWQNLPITARRFATRQEAETQPMRKALDLESDITLVCVGDTTWAPGCVACCGTHPSTTGQIGLIKLHKWENYKGMYRITFDAGDVALRFVREQIDVLRALCRRYSADVASLPFKLTVAEEKNQAARQQLHELKNLYADEQAKQLILRYLDGAGKNGRNPLAPNAPVAPCLLLQDYPVLKTDDLMQIGLFLPSELPILAALVSRVDTAVFLKSNGVPDCHKLVRDNAPVWNGKGGGRPDAARAVFRSRTDLDCFIDYLKQNYPACDAAPKTGCFDGKDGDPV